MPAERPKITAAKQTHVAAIQWELGSIKPAPRLAKSLKTMVGKPLLSQQLVQLLIAYSRSPQPNTARLSLVITRDGDRDHPPRTSFPHGSSSLLVAMLEPL